MRRECPDRRRKNSKSKGIVLDLTPSGTGAKPGAAKDRTKSAGKGETDLKNIKPVCSVPSTTASKPVKVTQSDTYVSVLDSIKSAASTADSNVSSAKSSSNVTSGSSAVTTTVTSLKGHKTSSAANVTSNSANANTRYSANFPVITNNAKNMRNSSNFSGSRSSKEHHRSSNNDGLISNPYSFNNDPSHSKSHQSKSNGQQPYISFSTASLKMTNTSVYSKPMAVPAVTLSDANLENNSLTTFVLANSKHVRGDAKSGVRRSRGSRDRDKPDRGN